MSANYGKLDTLMDRKVNLFCLGAVIGTLIGFLGCSREECQPKAPGIYVSEGKGKTIESMVSGDVIVRVNGENVTKEDFEVLLRVRTALFQIQGKMDLDDLENEAVTQFVEQTAPFLVMELIHHKMFSQYAAEKGIVPSKDQIEAARQAFAQSLSRKPADLERIAKRLGGAAGQYFADIPYINAQDELLRQSVTTNDLSHVTDEEIAQGEKYVENWNKTADRNNEGSRKRLAQARAEIDAGGAFAEVAAKYAQVHPEYGKVWQTVQLGELPRDEDLYKWLVQAKVGDISQPIDLEDGVAIVKLVSMGKGDAPPGVPLPDTYTLVRCTAYAYQYIGQLGRPEMRQELLQVKRQAAQRTLGVMLTERAVLEYPNGTNFFDSASVGN